MDTAIAVAGAVALSAALATAVGSAAVLAESFLAWARGLGRKRLPPAMVRRWAVGADATGPQALERRIAAALLPVLHDIVTEGALAGTRSAAAVLDHVEEFGQLPSDGVTLVTDWGRWEPGNPEAARQLLSADGKDELLSRLWTDAGLQVEGIAKTRVDDIAAVLADGLERGASGDEIAMALRGILDSATWAHTVAWTESNRATSAAALAEYAADGIAQVEWMTAFDQRVCARCAANEAAGPVAVGQRFPSGDRHPPGHPRCRCGLLPVVDGFDPDDLVFDDPIDKAAAKRNNLEHYWKNGEGRAKWVGTAHPWTNLYRHLSKHMPAGRAKRVASQWFKDVHGYWPGERKGRNPVGKG